MFSARFYPVKRRSMPDGLLFVFGNDAAGLRLLTASRAPFCGEGIATLGVLGGLLPGEVDINSGKVLLKR